MNYFIIETQEQINLNTGWKSIATTTVLADNSFQAFTKMSELYCENQYSHQVIFEIDVQHEEEITSHFLNS